MSHPFHPPAEVLEALRGGERIAIFTHTRPDADALGSALALQQGLEAKGKEAQVYCSDTITANLRFLSGVDAIVIRVTDESCAYLRTADLIVVCDAHDPSRIEPWWEILPSMPATKRAVLIDHHLGPVVFGSGWIEPAAASTAQLILAIFRSLRWRLTSEIATGLASGILGDTAHFKNSNSTPEALEALAYLVRRGANLTAINENLDTAGSLAGVQARGEILQHLQSEMDGRYTHAAVTRRVLEKYHLEDYEIEDLPNYLRSVDGTKIAAVFFELGPERIRVGLRGREGQDVRAIAASFGGGGHKVAAGCTLEMSLHAAERAIGAKVKESLMAQDAAAAVRQRDGTAQR